MSDCTQVDVLRRADGSGEQVIRFTNGRVNSVTWGAPVVEQGWEKTEFHETTWDKTQLDYEKGYKRGSAKTDQYEAGTATLATKESMGFNHQRNRDRDTLDLTPSDKSLFSVAIPLHAVPGSVFWPVFEQGATGKFRNPTGEAESFRLWGTDERGWEQWEFVSTTGITGAFTLGEAFSGSGLLKKDGQVLGALRWGNTGLGTLEPVGAGAVDAVPSAAARAFQFGAWIRNIAALGPMPTW